MASTKKKRRHPATPKAPQPKPPPLVGLTAYQEQLETLRQKTWDEWFVPWRSALLANEGNVTHAARSFDPPLTRSRGDYYTRYFGLQEFAANLREAATGHRRGRPKGA